MNAPPSKERVIEALHEVMDPELGRNLVDLGMVRDVLVEGARVRLTLALTITACPLKAHLSESARAAIAALPGVEEVQVETMPMTDEERLRMFGRAFSPQPQANRIRSVVAVMSGKGGVGKSMVTAVLATELRRRGRRVGILDADVTGPSIPHLFGIDSRAMAGPGGILPARSRLDIAIMSANLLLPDEDTAVIWRGPMIVRAIRQFWTDVLWGELDLLLVDLPPGTSDAALTVMQNLPLSGLVLVTTPQSLAAIVVRKGLHMAQQLGLPVLGVVENMGHFLCPDCGRRHELFGPGRAEELARQAGAPLLARLPLDPAISRLADEGRIEEYSSEASGAMAQAFGEAVAAEAEARKASAEAASAAAQLVPS